MATRQPEGGPRSPYSGINQKIIYDPNSPFAYAAYHAGEMGYPPPFDLTRALTNTERSFQMDYARGAKSLLDSHKKDIQGVFQYEVLNTAEGLEGYQLGLSQQQPDSDRIHGRTGFVDFSFLGSRLQGYKIGIGSYLSTEIERIRTTFKSPQYIKIMDVQDWQIPVFNQEFEAFKKGENGQVLDLLAQQPIISDSTNRSVKEWKRTTRAHTDMRDYWAYHLGLKLYLAHHNNHIAPELVSHPDRLYGANAFLHGMTVGEAVIEYMKDNAAELDHVGQFVESLYGDLRNASGDSILDIIDADFPFSRNLRPVIVGHRFASASSHTKKPGTV